MARMFLDAGCPRMLHTCCHQPGKQRHPAQGHRRIDRCCRRPRVDASGAHAACCNKRRTQLQHCSRLRCKCQRILPKGHRTCNWHSRCLYQFLRLAGRMQPAPAAGWGAAPVDAQVGMPHPGKATRATTTVNECKMPGARNQQQASWGKELHANARLASCKYGQNQAHTSTCLATSKKRVRRRRCQGAAAKEVSPHGE